MLPRKLQTFPDNELNDDLHLESSSLSLEKLSVAGDGNEEHSMQLE